MSLASFMCRCSFIATCATPRSVLDWLTAAPGAWRRLSRPFELIEVIARTQGQTGINPVEQEGFQELVFEAGMKRAWIVMGLEIPRLARFQ